MKKLILSIILAASQAFAQSAPPSIKGQLDSGYLRPKPNLQVPYNQATNLGGLDALIETDYENLLDNPSYESIVSTSAWTAGTGVTPTLDTSNVYSNKQAVSLALSSTNGWVWYQDVTPTIKMAGQPFEHGMWVINTALTNLQLCARNAGAVVGQCQAVPVNANYQYVVLNLSAPSSGSVGVGLFTTSSATGTVVVDNAYVGYARNLGISNLSTEWASYTPVFTGFGTVTNIECQQRRDGPDNLIRCKFTSGTTTAVEARVSLPGSNVSADSSVIPSVQIAGDSVRSGSGADQVFPLIEPSVGYITFGIQSATAAGLTKANANTFTTTANLFSFEARIPIAGWGPQTALAANTPSSPTIQTFTSGSGSYTKPNGVTYIKVRMVGGGGGGAGGGSGAPGTGGTGGTTSFGTSLLSANGGAGGQTQAQGGNGGVASCGSITSCSAFQGGMGSSGQYASSSGAQLTGGIGGTSPLGGAGGPGGYSAGGCVAGFSAVSNTGSGGGGSSCAGTPTGITSGGGGGAGGYVEAIINNPAASYTYTVGTAGAVGSAGGSGATGGAGGSGYIEVTEYYGAQNVPLLIGSVVNDGSGILRHFIARVAGASSTTVCSSSPCSLYEQSGSAFSGVTRTSTGLYLATLPAGMCSANPKCYSGYVSNTLDVLLPIFNATSPTSITIQTLTTATAVVKDSNFDIVCTCVKP